MQNVLSGTAYNIQKLDAPKMSINKRMDICMQWNVIHSENDWITIIMQQERASQLYKLQKHAKLICSAKNHDRGYQGVDSDQKEDQKWPLECWQLYVS